MGRLFSKSSSINDKHPIKAKEREVTSKDRAILDLKNSRDRLKKFKKKVFSCPIIQFFEL
jgi:hypothetical protein